MCGATMAVRPGSDRTMRGKVWLTLRCARCGHEEVAHVTPAEWRRMHPHD